MLLNAVYLYALPVEALAKAPILPVAEKASVELFGTMAADFVTIMLCISIAGAVSAMVWTGPRVYFAMAKDGLLPAFFSRTQHDGGTPGRSIILQSLWVTILVISGTFEQLVIYSGIILTMFTALTVGSVIVLRRKSPELVRPFLVPFYPVLPMLFITVSTIIVIFLGLEKPNETFWAILTLLGGIPLYFMMKKNYRTPGSQEYQNRMN